MISPKLLDFINTADMIQYESAHCCGIELFSQDIEDPDEDPILRDSEDDFLRYMNDLEGFIQHNNCWEKNDERLFFHKLVIMK